MADSSVTVVLLDTDPYHAMTPLIKIALSQFSDGDQTNNISQELSEKLHKLGPCQKLLSTKSDLTKKTTSDVLKVQYRSKLWDHVQAIKPHLCRTCLPRIHHGGTKTATAAKTKATESRGKNTIVTNYYCMSIVKHYLTFHPLQAL